MNLKWKEDKRTLQVWSDSVRCRLAHSVLSGTQQSAIQAAWCLNVPHAVTALLLTLPPHLLTSLQGSTETGTHSPPCLSLAALRHASGDKQSRIAPRAQSPRDVWKHAQRCQVEAEPCQAMSRTSWGLPDDSPRLIVRRHKVFFSPLSSDTIHRPLRLIPSCRV